MEGTSLESRHQRFRHKRDGVKNQFIWKLIEELTSDQKRPITKYLKLVFIGIGGQFHGREYCKLVICWKTYFIVSPLIIATSCLSYYFTAKSLLLEEQLWLLQTAAVQCSVLLTYYTINIFTENMRKLFKIIDNQFQEDTVRITKEVKKINFFSKSVWFKPVVAFLIGCLVTETSLSLITFFSFDPQYRVRFWDYPYPFPGMDSIQDAWVFIGLFFLQITTHFPTVVMTFLPISFFLPLSGEFFKEFLHLQGDIRVESQLFTAVLHKIHDYEVACLTGEDSVYQRKRFQILKSVALRKRSSCMNFQRNIIHLVKRYQKLIQSVKLFVPMLQQYFTVFLLLLTAVVITFGSFSLPGAVPKEIIFCVAIAGVLLLITIIWLYCEVGTTFTRMNKMITEEIYSTPWYKLPPTDRKIIYIFLCQTQNPVQFVSLYVFPISLELVPQFLNFVYSFIVFLRPFLLSKKHK